MTITDQHPRLTISESIRGKGRVESGEESVDVRKASVSRSKYDPSSRWTFELTAGGDSLHDPFGPVLRPYTRAPSFCGETETGQPFKVPQLVYQRTEADRMIGTAQEVWLGAENLPRAPRKQVVVADLTHTTLAVPEKSLLLKSYTGEIKAEDGLTRDDKPVALPSALGDLSLALHYRYEEVAVGSSRSTIRIPTPTLSLILNEDSLSTSPANIAQGFVDEIDPILRLLSFLSRQQVYWRRVQVTSELDRQPDAATEVERFEQLRAGVGDDSERDRERLVNPYRLGNHLFSLVEHLNASPYRESLLLAMLYTVSAQNARFVETSLLHAFTAWETITNGVSSVEKKDKILDGGIFAKLRAELRVLIKSFVDRENLRSEIVSDIDPKLGELNRLSFAPRAAELLERCKVPWEDLWLPGLDLLTCVRQVPGDGTTLCIEGTSGT